MIEKDRLLTGLTSLDDKVLAARALDKAELSLRIHAPQYLDFLDPHEREVVEGVLRQVDGVMTLAYGGYRTAERRRLVVAPGNYPSELINPQISCLDVKASSKFGELQHSDFLGAVMNLGLKREKFGDVIMSPEGAQVVVSDDVKEMVLSGLSRVGRASAVVLEIEFEQLAVEPERVKEIRATCASLRLDSVASDGFSTSRTKMAREIKASRVKVNWKDTDDPDMVVKQGDIISMRGRGRVVLEEITGNTKKGRVGILLKRYM